MLTENRYRVVNEHYDANGTDRYSLTDLELMADDCCADFRLVDGSVYDEDDQLVAVLVEPEDETPTELPPITWQMMFLEDVPRAVMGEGSPAVIPDGSDGRVSVQNTDAHGRPLEVEYKGAWLTTVPPGAIGEISIPATPVEPPDPFADLSISEGLVVASFGRLTAAYPNQPDEFVLGMVLATAVLDLTDVLGSVADNV